MLFPKGKAMQTAAVKNDEVSDTLALHPGPRSGDRLVGPDVENALCHDFVNAHIATFTVRNDQ
jgi:hypothetical protein